jgi:hypothetical protein
MPLAGPAVLISATGTHAHEVRACLDAAANEFGDVRF